MRANRPVDARGAPCSTLVPSDQSGVQAAAAGCLGKAARATREARKMPGAHGPRGPRSIVCAPARSNYGAAPQELEPERKQARPGLGLSTGCLPSCKLGPGADLAALTSPRPEAGTRLPVRHPQLAPVRLRFGHGFFGRPAGRGWYVRRGPQGRVLRHPAGRSQALSHLRVRSRTLNPAVQLSLPRAQARPMAATTKAAYHGQAGPCCSYTIHMPKMTQVQ